MQKRGQWMLLFLLLAGACQGPEVLQGLDQSRWKADKLGCQQDRTSMVSILSEQKNTLLGLGQQGVLKILGKPDKRELYTKSQQFFIYFLHQLRTLRAALKNEFSFAYLV